MHDSETTMFMSCKMAGINGIGIRTKRYTYTSCASKAPGENVPQTPSKILRENFRPWPKRTYDTDRATVLPVTRQMQALWGEPERASCTLAVIVPREWAMTGMEHTCMMGVGE